MNFTPSKLAPAIVIAALLGILCGSLIGPPMESIGWIGEFFLRLLKMVTIPLIIFSMIVGIGQLGDIRKLERTGLWTAVYYLLTTSLSVGLGIFLVSVLEPGKGIEVLSASIPERILDKQTYTLSDFFLSFIWPNIFDAMTKTKLLPIISFSLLFGGILTTMEERGRQFLSFIETMNSVMMHMVGIIMWVAPIGIFSLLAARIGLAGGWPGLLQLFESLGSYMATVILGLSLHACITLPLFLHFLGGCNVLSYFRGLSTALLSAFSTASSSATLPITLKCVKENNNIREEAADCVLPLGATINMDGTALYEAIAAIFIAQAWDIPLGGLELFTVFLTATLASIGAAGIPEAGLVTMVIVLQAVNLPLEGIGLILAVDWFLDRCRTTVNVWGDSVGAAVINKQAFPETIK